MRVAVTCETSETAWRQHARICCISFRRRSAASHFRRSAQDENAGEKEPSLSERAQSLAAAILMADAARSWRETRARGSTVKREGHGMTRQMRAELVLSDCQAQRCRRCNGPVPRKHSRGRLQLRYTRRNSILQTQQQQGTPLISLT